MQSACFSCGRPFPYDRWERNTSVSDRYSGRMDRADRHSATGASETRPGRRTNAERRATTRAAVLNATIDALVKYGYAGATSTRIAEISGYTRGAQKHHFDTKAKMVAEALVHVQAEMLDQLNERLSTVEDQSLLTWLTELWNSMQSDLFVAATELHSVARIDAELRDLLVPAEQIIGRRIRDFLVSVLKDEGHDSDRLVAIGEQAVNTLRGMAFQHLLAPSEQRAERQLRFLEESMRRLLRDEDLGTQ